MLKARSIIVTVFLLFVAESNASLNLTTVCSNYSPPIPYTQCRALVELYNQTNGDEWVDNTAWGSSDITTWYGVEVLDLGRGPEVTELELSNNNLVGNIPDYIRNFERLGTLRLGSNKLTGKIPDGIYDLKNLRILDFSRNDLEGSFDERLGGLEFLYYLSLSENKFKGSISESIFRLPSLVYLYLEDNFLTGEIPANISLPEIKFINLSRNGLTGEIPSQIFDQKSLKTLSLDFNGISGVIPSSISNSTNLEHLDLSHNYLIGVIPDSMWTIKRLRLLALNHNSLSGSIAIDNVDEVNIRIFDVSNNSIEGRLPESFSKLRQAEFVNLGNNKFTGTIPDSWSGLSELTALDVSNNYLSGTIPEFFGNLVNFNDFRLEKNYLYGDFPQEILSSQSLRTLAVSNNYFTNDFSLDKPAVGPTVTDYTQYSNAMQNSSTVDYTVTISSGGERGHYVSLPKSDEHGGVVYAIPLTGNKVVSISGCDGDLVGRAYILPTSAEGCSIELKFEGCDVRNDSCLIDAGKINGIRRALVENPSAERILSGVVQLRGWYYDEESLDFLGYDYLSSTERDLTLLIDNTYRFSLSTYLQRSDVVSAMKLNIGAIPSFLTGVGWDVLFNSGILENGNHIAQLYSETNEMIAFTEFKSFNLKGENGKYKFIKGDFSDIWIDNFPFEGSRSKLRFNQSEQSFSIIDQELEGKSTRSDVKHFSEDGQQPDPLRYVNSIPGVYFESPIKDQIVAGVVSIRGWDLDTFDSKIGHSIPGHFITFNDVNQIPLKSDDRFDLFSSAKSYFKGVGRSTLFYSGSLPNGVHRLRYWGRHNRRLLEQVDFEVFTPLNESGNPLYIKGVQKKVNVNNFPFLGSEVELGFDQASQSFTMQRQRVDGVEIR